MALVSVIEAAQILGVSTHTIKRRLKKGNLNGQQQATPQGYVWLVEVADPPDEPGAAVADGQSATSTATADGKLGEIVELLKNELEAKDHQVSFLEQELEGRRREVQELHVLLQQTQPALPAARDGRAWWRFWQR